MYLHWKTHWTQVRSLGSWKQKCKLFRIQIWGRFHLVLSFKDSVAWPWKITRTNSTALLQEVSEQEMGDQWQAWVVEPVKASLCGRLGWVVVWTKTELKVPHVVRRQLNPDLAIFFSQYEDWEWFPLKEMSHTLINWMKPTLIDWMKVLPWLIGLFCIFLWWLHDHIGLQLRLLLAANRNYARWQ